MRIAFVSGNVEQLPDPVIPIGLLYVMASCPPAHHLELWDLCFERDPAGRLSRELERFRPDLVAVGIRNAQGNDYAGTERSVEHFRRLVETIRGSSSAPVVVGGGGFSLMAEAWMQSLGVDYGVQGEGERAFAALVRALEASEASGRTEQLAAIPWLWWWNDGALRANPPPTDWLDLEELPPPDRRWVDARHYDRVGIESVQTKRGCALRCEYCTYPTLEGRRVRVRDPERVADEMQALHELHPGLHHLFVVDSVFNIPRAHALEVCRALARRRWSLPWSCYANPIGLDRELAELMASAGCVGLEVGVDSGCDEILVALRKGFDTAAVKGMQQACREAGLRTCPTFMVGTPRETLDDVRRTADFIAELDPFAAVIMLYTDPSEAMDAARRAEGQARRDAALRVVEPYLESHPSWIVPATGLNFDARLFKLLRRMGLRGPLWQHLDTSDARWRRLAGLRALAREPA